MKGKARRKLDKFEREQAFMTDHTADALGVHYKKTRKKRRDVESRR